jgi:hypothetical protein
MLIALNLKAPALRSSPYLAVVAKTALNAMVRANQLYLASEAYAGRPVPPLYSSGVRYAEEPWNKDGARVEEFADIPTVLARKWGDCDDLAPWRCAELRAQGEAAKIRISWKPTRLGRLFHVVVRRADGRVEDPSRVLGMGRG